MIKKSSWVFLLAISCYLTAANYTYAGWPINITLPIEGTITDAITGEPIENVIVSCEWVKSLFISTTFSRKLVITGRDGRYKIPGKISLHIISRFYYVEMSIRHPLYNISSYCWYERDIKELKKGVREWYYDHPVARAPSVRRRVAGYYRDSKIRLDIKLRPRGFPD